MSFELNRQIGVLVHRSGKVENVIVGSHWQIMIPHLGSVRASGGRLRGLRLIHTHLAGEDISDEDLMDLLFLRLDLLSVIKVAADGLPEKMYSAHLLPGGRGRQKLGLSRAGPSRRPDRFGRGADRRHRTGPECRTAGQPG